MIVDGRPQERSLEPLTGTDGNETMVDNPGDDDAGGIVQSN